MPRIFAVLLFCLFFTPSLLFAADPPPAPVPVTGQITTYASGDDGDLQKGVAVPDPRFTDVGDGTVTDNLTGLVWLKNANCIGAQTWWSALSSVNELANNACGLTDNSVAGDWRLPNINELESLIDSEKFDPALPLGHPFSGVQSNNYWSSTSDPRASYGNQYAWAVSMYSGFFSSEYYPLSYYVWPVRDGQ